MSRIILDQNCPIGIRQLLTDHEVVTALEMGWDALTNGKLLDAAEREGFHILVTSDQNLRYQQNLTGRRIALVVLGTTHWLTIKADPGGVVAACDGATAGGYVVVPFPKPPRLRRPSPKPEP